MDYTINKNVIFSRLSFIILAALMYRLFIATFFAPPLLQDEKDYFAIAQSLCHNNSFSINGATTAYRAPFYPAFVAIIFSIFGESVIPVRIIQAFADTLTCIFIFLICKRFFSEMTAYLAILLYSFFPGNSLYVSLLMSEILFTTLFLFAILLCSKDNVEHTPLTKILLGVVIAILTLIRQNAAILIVIFLIWDIFRFRSFKITIKNNALVLISFIMLLTPWLIRNKIQFDHFSITSNGGVNFWIGHNQLSNGSFKYINLDNPLESVPGEFERSALGYKEGINFLYQHPKEEVKLLFLKFAHFFEPDFSLMQSLQYKPEWKSYQKSIMVYREFSPVILVGLHLLTVMVVITGLWSLVFANDSKYQYLLLIRLVVVFWLCSHLIFFGVARFRLPIMPLFIVMAAQSVQVWRTKSFSVTKPKKYIFLVLSVLLSASWTTTFAILYFQQ